MLPVCTLVSTMPTPYTTLQLGPNDWWVVLIIALGGLALLLWTLRGKRAQRLLEDGSLVPAPPAPSPAHERRGRRLGGGNSDDASA
jgi:hypothetical protein